jgi:hypothetical protein
MSRKNVQMRGLKACVIGCSDRDNHPWRSSLAV